MLTGWGRGEYGSDVVRPSEFESHCQELGTWVNWESTTDVMLHGDPEIDVSGIAVTWLATDAVIREAARLGCNFIISHEGIYYPTFQNTRVNRRIRTQRESSWMKTGLRCSAVTICGTGCRMSGSVTRGQTFSAGTPAPRRRRATTKSGESGLGVADRVLERIEPLGQSSIQLMGDLDVDVTPLAIGTGAITRLPAMHELGVDILLATDDGTHTTYCGLWSFDLGIPVIIVCHPTSELPGMMALAEYVPTIFPDVDVHYLPCGLPYTRTLS